MDTNMENAMYDVAICGAGPVGMALAALLAGRAMPTTPARIAVIDARTLAQSAQDPRSIALSYGSRQILEGIGAWPLPATAIHDIHVSRRGRFGRSLIDRAEHGLPALGYVARYGDVVAGIGAACQRLGVTMLRPARLLAHEEGADDVSLTLADDGGERRLRAAVMVRAEGGLFADAREHRDERAQRRDYHQTALIAQVRTSAPVVHRAYERFTDEGPLALLPQDDGYSMVWCVGPATAQRLQALDDAAFLRELERTFGSRLGSFVAATPRVAYPLGLNAGPLDGKRTIAIGNAAQTLHPVAGQGLNLGLRDAAVLARLLARGATPAMLAEFTSLRQQDRTLTVRLTDTMARAFAADTPLQSLLGVSLAAIDIAAPARHMLAELMMFGRR